MSLLVAHSPASLRLFRVPLWLIPAFGMAAVIFCFSGSKPWSGYHLSPDHADLAAAILGLGLALACAWFDAMADPFVPKIGGRTTREPMGRRTALYLLSQIFLAPLVALFMIGLARWVAA